MRDIRQIYDAYHERIREQEGNFENEDVMQIKAMGKPYYGLTDYLTIALCVGYEIGYQDRGKEVEGAWMPKGQMRY